MNSLLKGEGAQVAVPVIEAIPCHRSSSQPVGVETRGLSIPEGLLDFSVYPSVGIRADSELAIIPFLD
ncbi:MAG: hypothetical protein ACO34E_02255 [Limisphaerales bacterium]